MPEFVSYQIAAVVLLSTSTVTVLRTLAPPRSIIEHNNLHLCVFTTLTASLHYTVMNFHEDLSMRIIIRYADWFITAPIIRLQMCAIDRVVGGRALQVG